MRGRDVDERLGLTALPAGLTTAGSAATVPGFVIDGNGWAGTEEKTSVSTGSREGGVSPSLPELERVVEAVESWRGRTVSADVLTGGLANLNYRVQVDDEVFVVKVITQEMDDFGLMIPVPHVIANTVAAGLPRVGARVFHVLPDVPALVLEHIDGKTLATEDLSEPGYVARIATAIQRLHTTVPVFGNRLEIWEFLDRYLGLVEKHGLPTPVGLLDALPTVSAIRDVLQRTAMPAVASHNDLLPKNLMDDGEIRLIDYDFSGASDPCFDLGDVAMEGDYSPDDVETLCEHYFGQRLADKVARARLFGIAAQYTWSLLFADMDQLLSVKPDAEFDYFREAEFRWDWTRRQLDASDIGPAIDRLARA